MISSSACKAGIPEVLILAEKSKSLLVLLGRIVVVDGAMESETGWFATRRRHESGQHGGLKTILFFRHCFCDWRVGRTVAHNYSLGIRLLGIANLVVLDCCACYRDLGSDLSLGLLLWSTSICSSFWLLTVQFQERGDYDLMRVVGIELWML